MQIGSSSHVSAAILVRKHARLLQPQVVRGQHTDDDLPHALDGAYG